MSGSRDATPRPFLFQVLDALLSLRGLLPELPPVGASRRRGRKGRRSWYRRLQRPLPRSPHRPRLTPAVLAALRARHAA